MGEPVQEHQNAGGAHVRTVPGQVEDPHWGSDLPDPRNHARGAQQADMRGNTVSHQ